jgi:hypothetical protein
VDGGEKIAIFARPRVTVMASINRLAAQGTKPVLPIDVDAEKAGQILPAMTRVNCLIHEFTQPILSSCIESAEEHEKS